MDPVHVDPVTGRTYHMEHQARIRMDNLNSNVPDGMCTLGQYCVPEGGRIKFVKGYDFFPELYFLTNKSSRHHIELFIWNSSRTMTRDRIIWRVKNGHSDHKFKRTIDIYPGDIIELRIKSKDEIDTGRSSVEFYVDEYMEMGSGGMIQPTKIPDRPPTRFAGDTPIMNLEPVEKPKPIDYRPKRKIRTAHAKKKRSKKK